MSKIVRKHSDGFVFDGNFQLLNIGGTPILNGVLKTDTNGNIIFANVNDLIDKTQFIQNQTTQQTSSNFNISGVGRINRLEIGGFDTITNNRLVSYEVASGKVGSITIPNLATNFLDGTAVFRSITISDITNLQTNLNERVRYINDSGVVQSNIVMNSKLLTKANGVNELSIDISGLGLTTLLGVYMMGIRNTTAVSEPPHWSLRSATTTTIVARALESNSGSIVIGGTYEGLQYSTALSTVYVLIIGTKTFP